LWTDAVDRKMYVTGGFGSEPRVSYSKTRFIDDPRNVPNRDVVDHV
jgi:DUF1680 family protein